MDRDHKIVFGLLVIQVVVTMHENVRLRSVINTLTAEYKQVHGELSYMTTILNKHDIELDEFDLIAMPHIRPRLE